MKPGTLYTQTFGNPGADGTLVFLHATGINGSTYLPLLRRLSFDGEVLVPSLRGHGRTSLDADPGKLKSWHILAADLLETLKDRSLSPPLTLAGHSSGAVTALIAAKTLAPQRLLLLEPVVLPEPVVWAVRTPFGGFLTSRFKVAQQAAARRADFPSLERVREAYLKRHFFSAWEPAAFDAYLEEGFRDIPGGVELSCAPAWEAAMFKAQAHGFWPHLKTVLGQGTRVDVYAAQDQTTFPLRARPRATRLGATLHEVEGGHMVPLEKPEQTAEWMTDRIAGVPTLVRV